MTVLVRPSPTAMTGLLQRHPDPLLVIIYSVDVHHLQKRVGRKHVGRKLSVLAVRADVILWQHRRGAHPPSARQLPMRPAQCLHVRVPGRKGQRGPRPGH